LSPVAGAIFQEVIDVAALLNAPRVASPSKYASDFGPTDPTNREIQEQKKHHHDEPDHMSLKVHDRLKIRCAVPASVAAREPSWNKIRNGGVLLWTVPIGTTEMTNCRTLGLRCRPAGDLL
jgi:hypothetical protein